MQTAENRHPVGARPLPFAIRRAQNEHTRSPVTTKTDVGSLTEIADRNGSSGLDRVDPGLLVAADAIGGEEWLYLARLSVDPAREGEGHAKAAIATLKGQVEADSLAGIALIADLLQRQRPGFSLLRFYRAQGFATAGETDFGPLMVWPAELAPAIRNLAAPLMGRLNEAA